MKLEKKNAVIYGAGGAIGSAVAKAFAREGAKVFVTGRNSASVAATAEEIIAAGGTAEAAQVDALDEGAVEGHIAAVFEKAGTVDISFNAITPIAQPGTQGIPIGQLPVESFIAPITAYMRSFFDRAGISTAYGRDSVRCHPHSHSRACSFGRTAVTMPLAGFAQDVVHCDRRRDRVAPTHPAPLDRGLLSNLHSTTTLRRHSWHKTRLQNF